MFFSHSFFLYVRRISLEVVDGLFIFVKPVEGDYFDLGNS